MTSLQSINILQHRFRVCLNPVPPLSHRKKMEGRTQKEGGHDDSYLGSRKKTPKPVKEAIDAPPEPVRLVITM